MKNIENNHVLTKEQKYLLQEFSKWENSKNFYLTGGTALSAFYLEHRFSEDLDFFTDDDEVRTEPIIALLKSIPAVKNFSFERKYDRRIFFIYFKDGGLMRTEFTPYPFKRIGMLKVVEGINVDSIIDILINKLLVISDRRDIKDYVDVYFILKEFTQFPMNELIVKVEEKFGLKGINYVLQGRFLEPPNEIKGLRLLREIDGKEMASFFRDIGRKMIRKSLEQEF